MGRFYCVFPLSFFYRPPDDIGFTLLSGLSDDRINTSTFGRKFYCHIFEWKNVVNQKFTTRGTVTNAYGTMYEIMNRPDGRFFSKRLFPPSPIAGVSAAFAPRKKPAVVPVHRIPAGPQYGRSVVRGRHARRSAWPGGKRRAAAMEKKNTNKRKNKNENVGVWRGGSGAGGFCRVSYYGCTCTRARVCIMALVARFRRGVTTADR